MSGFTSPAAPQQAPGVPGNFSPISFAGFDGLNTQPSRPAIGDSQMYWCDNWMPLGKNNLLSLPGAGSFISLPSVGSGGVIQFKWFNIAVTSYLVVFFGDGSAYFYSYISGSATLITSIAASTFPVGSGPGVRPAVSQWGSQYFLITCNDKYGSGKSGYWLFDGTLVYTSGGVSPIISINNVGSGYTSAPTIGTFGGSGSGATFTATITNNQVTGITVTNAGSGYTVKDPSPILLTFTGGGSTTTARATVTVTNGVVQTSGVTIVNGGTGYTSSAQVSFQGGGGSGATGTVTVASGVVTGLTITAGGTGYTSAPLVVITDANNPVAQAMITLMPFGVQGTAIETFQNVVWIANYNVLIFSQPGSPVGFSSVLGAGAAPSTNSFLKQQYTQLIQANGFLYVFGDSSIQYISGVNTTTVGTVATTTFSNINVDPQIGTIYRESIQTFSKQIVFLTNVGFYSLYGSTAAKVSDELDGILLNVQTQQTWATPTEFYSAQAYIYGKLCYMCAAPIYNFISQTVVQQLMIWDGKKWFTGSQEYALNTLASNEINGNLTAYASDGTHIFPILTNYSATLTKTVQSKFWDTPAMFVTKRALRIFGMMQQNKGGAPNITINIDADQNSRIYNTQQLTDPRTTASGQKWFKMDVNQSGYLMGLTITTNEPSIIFQSFFLVTQQYALEI